MSLLHPWFLLAALGGVALVVALHYYHRLRPRPQLAFSNLRMLAVVINERFPKKRLTEILLAVLRAAAAFLIVFSLAEPLLHWSAPGARAAEPRPGSGIFWMVLDNSYSMSYRASTGETLFAHGQAALLALVDVLRRAYPGSKFGLVVFGGEKEQGLIVAPTQAADELKKILAVLTPNSLVTRQGLWPQALAKAAAGPTQAIFVFTDLAQHGFAEAPVSGLAGLKAPVIFVQTHPGDFANTKLSMDYDEATGRIHLKLDCYGKRDRSSAQRVRLRSDEGPALATLNIASCQESVFDLKTVLARRAVGLQDGPAGGQRLRFELEPDPLVFDDSQEFVVYNREGSSLLLVDGEPGRRYNEGESFYVREALKSVNYEGAFHWISQEELARLAQQPSFLAQTRELWLLHPQQLQKSLLAFLQQFLADSSNKLVLSLGPKADLAGLSALLGIEWTSGQEGGGGSAFVRLPSEEELPQRRSRYWLGGIPLSDLKHFELDKVAVDRYVQTLAARGSLRPWLFAQQKKNGRLSASGAQGAALSESGQAQPLLFEVSGPQAARVFVFTSTLDVAWTNMPHKGFFLSLIKGLAAERSAAFFKRNVFAGETLRWRLPASMAKALKLKAPSGAEPAALRERGDLGMHRMPARDTLGMHRMPARSGPWGAGGAEPDLRYEQDELVLGPFDEMGIYRIQSSVPRVGEFSALPAEVAVRLPPAHPESDLTPAGKRQISRFMGQGSVWHIVDAHAISANPGQVLALFESRRLMRPAVLAGLIFLTLEPALSLWITRRSKS